VAFSALQRFEKLGFETREVEVPPTRALVDGWASVTAVECAMAHAGTFPSRADDYGPELRALIELGASVSGADYARMEIERASFKHRLEDLFDTIDLLLLPALTTLPPHVEGAIAGNPAQGDGAGNLLQFTAPFDFSGSPTLSLPGGFTQDGIPIGFQLVARHVDEALLCRAGYAYQGVTDWHQRRPPIA
jgi:amidase